MVDVPRELVWDYDEAPADELCPEAKALVLLYAEAYGMTVQT